MPKTIEQILANHAAHAARSEMGIAAAKEKSNYQLAAFNCEQAFKSMLMQGLVVWRSGDDPTEYFGQAITRFRADWHIVQEVGGESAKLSDVGYEQVPFVAYLIDRPLPFSTQPNVTAGLECDRLLDAVLGQWLFGAWNDSLWETGMEALRVEGSELAVETYAFYRQVTLATEKDLPQLELTEDDLFRRRKKDGFFAGGVQTCGGGPDNEFTVDYRFAALAKHIGHGGESIHAWRW